MRFHAIFMALALLAGCAANPDQPAQTDALRVLTYNTHHGEGTDGVLDLERIARVISAASPDLVALQEIDVRAQRTGSVDQAAELARLTGMHHAFGRFMDFQGGQYGLAILSRYPLENVRTIELPPGEHEPRTALAATVTPTGRPPVTLVCLHLDWLRDDANRYAQARALIAAIEHDRPVILAGDFNDRPGSRTMEAFDAHFVNAEKPDGARNTFPSHAPDHEIDFIMYGPASAFTGEARVLDERVASDHRPVLAVLQWVR